MKRHQKIEKCLNELSEHDPGTLRDSIVLMLELNWIRAKDVARIARACLEKLTEK